MKGLLHSCRAAAFLVAACLAFRPVAAADLPKSQIMANLQDQQQVRDHTSEVSAQVQGLIDEMLANGISGDDTKVLQATKAALKYLSGPEMEKVVASLQKAGASADALSATQSATDAYAGQKAIILQFRQILKDYQQRQAAYELPVRFKELADRQTETMRTTIEVARATAGKSQNELTAMQSTTQQIVQADQDALANEVGVALDQLHKAAQENAGDGARPMQQAQKEIDSGQLQKALDAANADLKQGKLLAALTEQKTARDALQAITKDLNPAANAVEALAGSAAEVAALIDGQKKVLDQTNTAVAAKTADVSLAEKQGDLVDKADTTQKDLQTLSAPAAELVKDAMTPMQTSRARLRDIKGFPGATQSQQEAIANLEDAEKQLQQQLASAEKAADTTKDPVAALQGLQKQIQTAQQQQQQAANQANQALANTSPTTPPDANALAQAQQAQTQSQQATSALQQSAQNTSLPASQALAAAATAMNQAQQALSDPSAAAKAPAAQQAAANALAQASQAVSSQLAQAQQQSATPAALASAANALQNAQSNVSSALAATSPAASSPPASSSPPSSSASSPSGSPAPSSASPSSSPASTPPSGAPNMAAAAAALAQAATNAQAAGATPGLPASAAAAVEEAKKDIAQGKGDAAKGDAKGTATAAAAAQGALAQAQASVAMAQSGMAASSMAGEPGMMPGTMPGTPPGMVPTPPGPDTPSPDGAKMIAGGSTDKGTLHDSPGGVGKFITVTSRDRSAIGQTSQEKRPQEYSSMIDQYMKNLADQATSTSP